MSDLIIDVKDGPSAAVKIISLVGEMDEGNINLLQNKLEPFLNDSNIETILFDLSKMEFINSKGIGYFVSIHTHLAKDNRIMILTGASEPVMDVISLVGLTMIIKYFDTLEEALNNL